MDEKIQQPETQQAIFLAMLIELADEKGVIRKTAKELIEEAQNRKIFIGTQSNLWLRREIKKLVDCNALQIFYRMKYDSKRKNLRMGMHFFYRFNQDKTVLFEILDRLPTIPSVGQLKTKLVMSKSNSNQDADL